MSVRDRYVAFIEHHDVAWELSFATLAVVFVVVGFVDETPLVTGLEFDLTALFAAEFASRLAASHDRAAYLRGHWIDLAALMPTTRALRVARLLRLLRLVRAFAGLYRAAGHLSALAQHRGLMWLFAAWLSIMAICSLALYAAENGLNEAVRSPFDALWWGVVTLTTVGYGDVVPKTDEAVTSFMLEARPLAPEPSAASRLRELHRLHADGIVTAEEYESKRIGLLDEI